MVCTKDPWWKWLFSFYKEHLVTLKPSIVLLACVHGLEHCKVGEEQHVYQCFSNHPTVCQSGFLFYRNTKYDYIYDPSPKKRDWLSLGTLLKVLFAISGVFSWFSHVAGNIYFALLHCFLLRKIPLLSMFSSLTVIVPLTRQLPHSLLSRLALV